MRWLVVFVASVTGCGFSLQFGDNVPVDARTDGAADAPVPDGKPDDALFACPVFYRQIGSGFYAVLDPTNWRNHMAACASHGTHLAVIDNAQELADLVIYGQALPNVMNNSRFYVGLVQAPDQAEPDDNWVDFHDNNAQPDLWAQSGNNQPDDGPDDNENNHQEQVGAIQLDLGQLTDIAQTENVRAYCECDGIPIGTKAQSFITPLL